MLACVDRCQHEVAVVRHASRNSYHIDVRIRDQRVAAGVSLGDAEGVRCLLRGFLLVGCDRDELEPIQTLYACA